MTSQSPLYVDHNKLRALVTDIYQKLGVETDTATLLSDSLVAADLWGHSSHGVLRTSWYGSRLLNQVMDKDAPFEILLDTGPLLAIDGHNGIGQKVAQKATELVIEKAKTFGVAAASIQRSGHFGTAMYFTRQIAAAEMIGFLATNASPAMAAFGGVEKMVGNNPQSWAAPTDRDAPFVLDIAHTEVARGKIYLAKEKREKIPAHWALSADGRPTTDPAEAIVGTLLPMAGHKGFGLSAMMDVLSGVLSDGTFGSAINGPYVPDKPSGVGHFLFAIDIGKLRDIAHFKSDMGNMIESWKNSQKMVGVETIFYPGEKEFLHHKQAVKDGIALAPDTLSNLLDFARQCGLNPILDTLKIR